ncbi:CRISPR-associated helicase Cas3' [Sporosarcina limicola]|uniref:CRISPR-associated endonuclease/helicase Cas3 n=1 Tax=Sporosarcina limicola TaxID=34101 RepID=A0A927MFZ5_9BACL|nr:CRISPR-associated helicase Cas3' [Sporosarcina limicola]MBE1553056.1 CRISPR-associated endonuclease/helicase Cas3 [Sporosarcina limicola]
MIAHMRKSDFKIQKVQDHLISVSLLAKKFGEKAGFSSMAELSGFLHDMGKNTKAFSTYIENAVKETGESLERIDHSTAGAKYLYETYYVEVPKTQPDVVSNFVVEIVGMVILSHHSGLQNFIQPDGSQSDFFRRVCREDLPYYGEVQKEFFSISGNKEKVEKLFEASLEEMKAFFLCLQQLLKNYPNEKNKEKTSQFIFFSLVMKYVFSCLIDADRTDSRRFDEEDTTDLYQSNQAFFKESYDHLIDQLEEWAAGPNASKPINKLRAEMSEQCDRLAGEASSIYQLSIPTGGGKTYASLRYALKHAQMKKKDRIIYVVPYTTIIEQNADAVRKIIKNEELVLEHHSNVIDDAASEDGSDYYRQTAQKKMQLARDNWDHPIIFTTMVQFLDTFYAKGTRKARRLHNLTNAIVIFDEVQSVPVKHIPLFNSAVNFLHHFGKSSIILCTATQPSLTKTSYPLLMDKNAEMVKYLPDVVKAFERVNIESKVEDEGWTAEEISGFAVDELKEKRSLLIILNTKKAVLNVYQQLKETQGYSVYHLSTSMCPQHRKDILKMVKEKLKSPKEKVICISTQLIEAGVDISFECVIRSLAGLDSIAQAAGRCNRNAEREKGIVYIIRAKDEALSKLPEIALGQEVTEEDILSRSELAKDLLSPAAIQTYFDFYLNKAGRKIKMTDSKLNVELIELLDRSPKYVVAIPKESPKTLMCSMYKTLESHFEVIEAPTTAILVPYGEGKELINNLNEDIHDYDKLNEYLKKAQQYSVNVYRHTLQDLASEGLITSLYNDSIYALRDGGYHKEYGLEVEGEGKLNHSIF